jgi:cytoskeletal protein CcmA (bactofilin family)
LLAADVEQGVAGLERQPSAPPPVDVFLTDLSEVQSLFAQLAVSHARQICDFMIDLHTKEANVDWVEICAPALRSLRGAAAKLELRELCSALDRFSAALAWAQASGSRTIDGERRATILSRFQDLRALMPQAFELDFGRVQGESIILQSLLLQVHGMNKATLDRLYAAGLTTLESMYVATPAALVATAGIDDSIARGVVRRFGAYRVEVSAAVPDATRASERERLSDLALAAARSLGVRVVDAGLGGRVGGQEEGAAEGAHADAPRHQGAAGASRRGRSHRGDGAPSLRCQGRAARSVSRGSARQVPAPALNGRTTMTNGRKTMVDEGTSFRGSLSSDCPVEVKGRVEGDLTAPALVVASGGAVHGKIKVGEMTSQGELAGEFDADVVKLSGTVKNDTVVRARSLEVKLAPATGKMQVIFGECQLDVGAERTAGE